MYNQPESTSCNKSELVKAQTESERILLALDCKLDALDMMASTMVNKVTTLGGFELLKSEATDVRKPNNGGNFIGELDIRIDRIQRLIEGYGAILYNLERLA